MGFGLIGRRTTGHVAAAMMIATALIFVPVAMSTMSHAENNDSEENRNIKFKKNSGLGVPGSDLSAASKVSTKTEVVAGQNIAPMLSASSASQMGTIAARYETIVASGGFPNVPRGIYKKGSKGSGVAALNKRLFMDGYLRKEATEGEFADIFTTATQDAVSRFQRNMGMNPSGKIDIPTLAQLNVSAEQRLRTIEANISRLQTYSQNLGDRYLIVNVPAQQLETVSGGKVYSRHNVIVGRPERPTPVVMTALDNVSFNPYWNAPASIVEQDIIPKLQSGSNIIEELNIKVFQGFGGPEVDPKTIDWNTATADQYFFREEPGPKSAMATAKINFNSPFGIYLHDTPDKQLFSSSTRFYSSGCVRVENMPQLVQWVINGQEGIGADQIASLAETLEQKIVTLAAPPQLRVTYLTAWPVGNTVAFRNDVYGLDGTGFVTGQPMPVGELSDDGQRFVLKPVPRKAAAVDAAEAEGFSIFGSRSKTTKKAATKATTAQDGVPTTNSLFAKSKKPATVANKPQQQVEPDLGYAVDTKNNKKVGTKKAFSGLFDWASYRKEQQQGASVSNLKKTKAKKKIIPASSVTDSTPPTPKIKPGFKEGVVAKTTDSKKIAPPTPVAKPKAIASNCKPDASGQLPSNCKAAAN